MWSDHGAPAQGRWWKTRSRRSARSSTGLKILFAAGVLVAGVIGISGVYPKVIDPQWVQGAGTYASRVSAPDARTTTPDAKITPDAKMTGRSDSPASIQAPSRSIALTTSEAPAATSGPAAVVPPPRAAHASKPLAQPAPLAIAETSDAAVNADAPPTPAPTVAAKPAAPVVKRRVVSRVEHPRRGAFTFGPFAFGGSPFRM
jgi:hypothetical protein